MGLLLVLSMRVSSLDRSMSLYFENEKPYNLKLGQILHFSTPFAVKIEEGWAKCLSRNEGQVSDFMIMFIHFEATICICLVNEIVYLPCHAVQLHPPRYSCVRICICLLYTSPSPRDRQKSRMPSSA